MGKCIWINVKETKFTDGLIIIMKHLQHINCTMSLMQISKSILIYKAKT